MQHQNFEPVVDRVFLFNNENGGKTACGVSMNFGPINIRGWLVKGEKGYFLSLPSRKNESSSRYFNVVSFHDASLKERFEKLAIAAYEEARREKEESERLEQEALAAHREFAENAERSLAVA